jgi:hypothetical protein
MLLKLASSFGLRITLPTLRQGNKYRRRELEAVVFLGWSCDCDASLTRVEKSSRVRIF